MANMIGLLNAGSTSGDSNTGGSAPAQITAWEVIDLQTTSFQRDAPKNLDNISLIANKLCRLNYVFFVKVDPSTPDTVVMYLALTTDGTVENDALLDANTTCRLWQSQISVVDSNGVKYGFGQYQDGVIKNSVDAPFASVDDPLFMRCHVQADIIPTQDCILVSVLTGESGSEIMTNNNALRSLEFFDVFNPPA